MATITDLQAANPYRNQTYNKSGWQKFLSALGFRTQADAWEENMAVQAAEYDAALLQKQHDEQYDSAPEQVGRMRAAGLNPDLDPSSISAGSHAPMGEDSSTPMQSTGDEENIASFANGVLSAFSTALGIVSSFQGIHRNHLENKLLDLSYDKEDLGISETLNALSRKYAFELLPTSAESEIDSDSGMARSWLDLAFDKAKIFSKSLPSKYRNTFLSSVNNFWHSAPTEAEAYKVWREKIGQEKGYEIDKRTNYSFVEADLAIIADEFAELFSKSEKARARGGLARAEADESAALFQGAVTEGLDAEAAAAAENSQKSSVIESAQFSKEVHSSINRIIGSLKKNDDVFSKLLVILISSMQLNLIPH